MMHFDIKFLDPMGMHQISRGYISDLMHSRSLQDDPRTGRCNDPLRAPGTLQKSAPKQESLGFSLVC